MIAIVKDLTTILVARSFCRFIIDFSNNGNLNPSTADDKEDVLQYQHDLERTRWETRQ